MHREAISSGKGSGTEQVRSRKGVELLSTYRISAKGDVDRRIIGTFFGLSRIDIRVVRALHKSSLVYLRNWQPNAR
jgi:hypothetical protein